MKNHIHEHVTCVYLIGQVYTHVYISHIHIIEDVVFMSVSRMLDIYIQILGIFCKRAL